MIKIEIKPTEVFDQSVGEHGAWVKGLPGGVFRFENSLLAISKWEAEHMKPFLNPLGELTPEEELDFYYKMCLDDGFKKEYLTSDVVEILKNYIRVKHTATTINSREPRSKKNKIMTSEEIYAHMAIARLPFETELWEINRLLVTLTCIGILQNPEKEKKRSQRAIAKDYQKMNAMRKAKLGVK